MHQAQGAKQTIPEMALMDKAQYWRYKVAIPTILTLANQTEGGIARLIFLKKGKALSGLNLNKTRGKVKRIKADIVVLDYNLSQQFTISLLIRSLYDEQLIKTHNRIQPHFVFHLYFCILEIRAESAELALVVYTKSTSEYIESRSKYQVNNNDP